MEFRFRYAQASDALAELCRLRQLFQGTRDQNAKHTKSTSSTTRSQGTLDVFRGKIKRVANRYRSAYRALSALDPEGKMVAGWKHYFLELKDTDIRGPDREVHETSEGRFQQSWIWTVSFPRLNLSTPTPSEAQHSIADPTSLQPPASSTSASILGGGSGGPAFNENDQHQFHRAHWSRAQARAERYEEEVMLTVEEMGRTLEYFKWKKSWWQSILLDRAKSDNPPPPDVQDGLCAYTNRQSFIYGQLITLFVNHWRGFLSTRSLGSSWLHNYPLDDHPIPPARPHRGHRKSDARHSGITSESPNPNPACSTVPQKYDDSTEAPLDNGSSEEDSDDDFILDNSWDDDSADDD